MQLVFFDFLGVIGTALIIGTYILLQLGRIESRALSYSILNASGATLIIVSLFSNFNLAAFIVEFFWVLISIYGIIKHVLSAKAKS